MFEQKLSAATVKSYLTAVRHAQIALSLGDPKIGSIPQLEYVIKGLKRSATYSTSRTRLPVTPELLGLMKAVWRMWGSYRDAAMLWAAVTMCFCGFLRSGEVVVPSQSGYDPTCHLS